MSERQFIGCMPWGSERLPSVEVKCVKCAASVALSVGNVQRVERDKVQPLCLSCAWAEVEADPDPTVKAMIEGREYTDPEKILNVLDELETKPKKGQA